MERRENFFKNEERLSSCKQLKEIKTLVIGISKGMCRGIYDLLGRATGGLSLGSIITTDVGPFCVLHPISIEL